MLGTGRASAHPGSAATGRPVRGLTERYPRSRTDAAARTLGIGCSVPDVSQSVCVQRFEDAAMVGSLTFEDARYRTRATTREPAGRKGVSPCRRLPDRTFEDARCRTVPAIRRVSRGTMTGTRSVRIAAGGNPRDARTPEPTTPRGDAPDVTGDSVVDLRRTGGWGPSRRVRARRRHEMPVPKVARTSWRWHGCRASTARADSGSRTRRCQTIGRCC